MIGLFEYINFVAERLRRIHIAAGFTTDAGANVVTERLSGNGDDKKLVVGVFLTDLARVAKTAARRDWQFDLRVEARVPTKLASAERTCVDLLEDLVAAIPTAVREQVGNLQTLEVTDALIDRQTDDLPYNVVGVTLRGTCFEYTASPA